MQIRSSLWVIAALATSACGGWSSSTNTTVSPSGSPLDQARAYERGTGVARDYHAAAEVYRTACDNGRGNLVACDALIRAHLRGRGVDERSGAARALANAVCLQRRDPFACVAAGVLADPEAGMPQALRDTVIDVAGNLELCDVAHLSDCRARLLVDSDVSGRNAQRERRRLRLQACRAGIVDGCVEIVRARHAESPDIEDAERQLQIACDAHDAEACAAAPTRTPVPLAELCTASDYAACAQLGCQGDATAREKARGHGVNVAACDRFNHPSAANRIENALAKMTEFKDHMCVCADKQCADRVTEDMTKWGQEQARLAGSDGGYDRVSEEDTKQIARVVEEMTKCMTRAMMAGQTTP